MQGLGKNAPTRFIYTHTITCEQSNLEKLSALQDFIFGWTPRYKTYNSYIGFHVHDCMPDSVLCFELRLWLQLLVFCSPCPWCSPCPPARPAQPRTTPERQTTERERQRERYKGLWKTHKCPSDNLSGNPRWIFGNPIDKKLYINGHS